MWVRINFCLISDVALYSIEIRSRCNNKQFHCECNNIDLKSSQKCWPLDERTLPFLGQYLAVVYDSFHPDPIMEDKFNLEAFTHHWRRHSTSTRLSPLINWLQISRNMLKFPLLVTSSKDPMVNTPIWKKKKNYKSSSSSKILSRKARSRWLPAPAVNVSSVMHKLYLCFALFVLLNWIFILSYYSYQGNRQTDRGNGCLWMVVTPAFFKISMNVIQLIIISKLLITVNSFLCEFP